MSFLQYSKKNMMERIILNSSFSQYVHLESFLWYSKTANDGKKLFEIANCHSMYFYNVFLWYSKTKYDGKIHSKFMFCHNKCI